MSHFRQFMKIWCCVKSNFIGFMTLGISISGRDQMKGPSADGPGPVSRFFGRNISVKGVRWTHNKEFPRIQRALVSTDQFCGACGGSTSWA